MPNLEHLQQKFIDLSRDLAEIPKDKQADAKDAVGQFLVDAILVTVAKAESPVTGDKFQPLNDNYAEFKKEQGGQPIPNLELEGDLLKALGFNRLKDGIAIGIVDPDERPKADGHNNFSGKSKLPLRRFIPGDKEQFAPEIQVEISKILDEYKVKPPEITARQAQEGEPLSVSLSNIISDDVLIKALLRRING